MALLLVLMVVLLYLLSVCRLFDISLYSYSFRAVIVEEEAMADAILSCASKETVFQ